MRDIHYCSSCHRMFYKKTTEGGFCPSCNDVYFTSFSLQDCVDIVSSDLYRLLMDGLLFGDISESSLKRMFIFLKELIKEQKRFNQEIAICVQCSFVKSEDIGFYSHYDTDLNTCPICFSDITYVNMGMYIKNVTTRRLNVHNLFTPEIYTSFKRINNALDYILNESEEK